LKKPLPGLEFQMRMSSMARIRELFRDIQQTDPIKSGVLILVFPSPAAKEAQIVLIQRPVYEGVHSGQIALPGGRFEEHDENLVMTALREAQEETGIDPSMVNVLGTLTELYIPPSNFIVTPVVGYAREELLFRRDPEEVDEIIILKIKDLVDDRAIILREFTVNSGLRIEAPCFDINGHCIWGATAMILSEFKEIIRRSGWNSGD